MVRWVSYGIGNCCSDKSLVLELREFVTLVEDFEKSVCDEDVDRESIYY